MAVIHDQLQMGANTARGAARNSVLALTCRWQDRKHGLAVGRISACEVCSAFQPHLAGVRPGPFSHSSLRVPSRAKAAVLFPSRQMSSRHKFSDGSAGERFAGAPRSRRIHIHLPHHFDCQVTDAAEHIRRLSSLAVFDALEASDGAKGSVPLQAGKLPPQRGELPHVGNC